MLLKAYHVMKTLSFCGSLLSIVVLFCGCASIVDGGAEKNVAIYSTPPGAKLTVFDKEGRAVLTGTTPAIVNLRRHHSFFNPETYRLRFEYLGFYPSETFVTSKLDKWYLANFYSGGPIGFFAVDPATGAMWTLPPEINRNLTSTGSALSHEELKAAEKAANPDDAWRQYGVIEKDF
jgi:hypothetical protein